MGNFQGVGPAVEERFGRTARRFLDPGTRDIDEALFPEPEVVRPPAPTPPPPVPEEPDDEANIRARRRRARGRRGTFLTGDLVPTTGQPVGRLGG